MEGYILFTPILLCAFWLASIADSLKSIALSLRKQDHDEIEE